MKFKEAVKNVALGLGVMTVCIAFLGWPFYVFRNHPDTVAMCLMAAIITVATLVTAYGIGKEIRDN